QPFLRQGKKARFDCASRPGDRYDRSPGRNKASGRSAPFLRQGRQNDVWRRGEKATHEIPDEIRGCQKSQTSSRLRGPRVSSRRGGRLRRASGASSTKTPGRP